MSGTSDQKSVISREAAKKNFPRFAILREAKSQNPLV
jgi:hypothetical protein